MTLSKGRALSTSLSVIVLYWLYEILWRDSNQTLPAAFPELVLRIARNKLIVLVAVVLLLRLQGEDLRALGVSRRDWPKHLGIGLVLGVVMFVGLNVALTSMLNALIPWAHPSGTSILSFFKQPRNLLFWILIAILGGGIFEEIQRIFILTRFGQALGRRGLVLGAGLTSVMFGFGHLYQGLGSSISTGIAGLAFSPVYLRRRSTLEPIAAHALSDVLAVIAAAMLAG